MPRRMPSVIALLGVSRDSGVRIRPGRYVDLSPIEPPAPLVRRSAGPGPPRRVMLRHPRPWSTTFACHQSHRRLEDHIRADNRSMGGPGPTNEDRTAQSVSNAHGSGRATRFALTKFRPPALPATLISRSGLHDQLAAGSAQRLTVVVGSAGAGKSVLLADWAAARPPGATSWLSCDRADADPV